MALGALEITKHGASLEGQHGREPDLASGQ